MAAGTAGQGRGDAGDGRPPLQPADARRAVRDRAGSSLEPAEGGPPVLSAAARPGRSNPPGESRARAARCQASPSPAPSDWLRRCRRPARGAASRSPRPCRRRGLRRSRAATAADGGPAACRRSRRPGRPAPPARRARDSHPSYVVVEVDLGVFPPHRPVHVQRYADELVAQRIQRPEAGAEDLAERLERRAAPRTPPCRPPRSSACADARSASH